MIPFYIFNNETNSKYNHGQHFRPARYGKSREVFR